jgi:hypothetical protein
MTVSPLIIPESSALIGDDPVFYCQIDDFLPPADYLQLRDSFPDAGWFSDVIEGNKKRINSRRSPEVFDKFCTDNPAWQQLFEQMRSKAFIDSLYALLQKPLRLIRGPIGGRTWYFDEDAGAGGSPADWFKRRAVLSFEFSRLENGASVPPHTDTPEKLASLILYFADPRWRPEWGGDTRLYRPKHKVLLRNWHNRRVPFDQLDTVMNNEFVGNRLFIFTKSADSYHGVPEIHCPPDIARNSVNINVVLRAPTRFRRLHKMRSRLGRRIEQRRHPC